MTTKTITDQAGDTVRISTGTLTAPTGHVTVKVNEHYLGREYSAAAHADPAALRAALDEVAPLGKYTRTTPDPDDMDGGVTAALIEKEVEQPDAEVRELRSALARELARGNALQDALDAAGPRPLTPDAITDEMVERYWAAMKDPGSNYDEAVRRALAAALTEPPARPEAVEDIVALLDDYGMDDFEERDLLAEWLAERGVRVVTEDGAA